MRKPEAEERARSRPGTKARSEEASETSATRGNDLLAERSRDRTEGGRERATGSARTRRGRGGRGGSRGAA